MLWSRVGVSLYTTVCQGSLECQPLDHQVDTSVYVVSRACLDQLLIAIRSFTLLCDHSWSKTRLIAIMNLTAKLGIIYATACHVSLYRNTLDCLTVNCHCRHTVCAYYYNYTNTARGREVGISQSVATAAGTLGLCKVLFRLPLTACRNTPFLPSSARPGDWPTDGDRPSTLVSYCQHSGLLR